MSALPLFRPLLFLVVMGAACLLGCASSSGKLVTVRSVVDPGYVVQRAERDPARSETFVLLKGRMLSGSGYNRELATTDFNQLVGTLGTDLTRAGYRPAPDSRTADLVIVVHWGMTTGIEREADMLAYDPDNIRQAHEAVEEARAKALADAGTANALQSQGAVSAAEAALRAEANHAASLFSGNDLQESSNADLLGYREVLQASQNLLVPSSAGETLRELVNEERYFAVLHAYDAQAARQGQKRRLWTTRMSITAAGQSFRSGLDRMSHTAATSHGTPQAGILIAPSQDRPTVIETSAPRLVP